MQSQPNNELEAQFLRAFRNAVKMREAEEKQNPFSALVFNDNQGKPIHVMRIGKN